VPLNLQVPAAGTGYRLLVKAYTGITDLLRENPLPTGVTFPITSPSGQFSITNGYNATPTAAYYYFYNIILGNECVAASRTPIQVNVTPGLVATLPTAAATICGSTPYALSGSIAGTATGGVYTSSGTGTFAPNATTINATYTASAADIAAGTVTLTLTPTGPSAPCTQTAAVVLTIGTPPASGFSYPAGVYCTNSPVTVTPVLAPGASAGTFSASGFGLRINATTGVITLANTNIDGTFTITNTVTGTGACSGGSSSSTTFTVTPGVGQPTLTATTQPNGSVLLSTPALIGVTYQFFQGTTSMGPASTSNTLLLAAGTQSGSYTVVVTSAAGCASVPSAPVSVVVTSTQTATLNGVSLLVYPNPTPNGHLTLELRGARAKASQLTVLNALGQVVHSGVLSAGLETLSLTNLASGVYTVRVLTTEGVLTQRVVRE
jgi:hypothetical protein